MSNAKTKELHRMVEYDESLQGFVYQITENSPLRGPFKSRAGAVADAKWNIHHGTPEEIR